MNELHTLAVIAVAALVTIVLRFAPFLIFRGQTPPVISWLGRVLPFAIMGMLVVYCLKEPASAFAWKELLGCAVVALLHIWKRSTLLSIAGGTAVYMLLSWLG